MTALRLAHTLGCTLEELGERMSSHEFALHQAYWRIEPSGPQGEVHRWASMMAAIANGPLMKRDKSQFRAEDFYPADAWEPPPPPPKPGEKRPMMAPDFSHLRGMKVAPPRKR